jgi:HSP20 family protein
MEMAIIRWQPALEVQSLQHEVNRLFGTLFDSPTGTGNGTGNVQLRRWIPAMDLVETDTDYVLRADLPGLSREDVKLEFEDGVLNVSGERTSEHDQRGEGYYRIERSSGRFSRSLTLPEGVDAQAIEAKFDNGVLEVRIPKPQQRKPQRVAITVAGQPATIEGAATPTIEQDSPDGAQTPDATPAAA